MIVLPDLSVAAGELAGGMRTAGWGPSSAAAIALSLLGVVFLAYVAGLLLVVQAAWACMNWLAGQRLVLRSRWRSRPRVRHYRLRVVAAALLPAIVAATVIRSIWVIF